MFTTPPPSVSAVNDDTAARGDLLAAYNESMGLVATAELAGHPMEQYYEAIRRDNNQDGGGNEHGNKDPEDDEEPPRIIAAGGAFGLNRNVVEVVGKQLFSKKKVWTRCWRSCRHGHRRSTAFSVFTSCGRALE
jgi:hypothetical protein